MDDPMWSMEPEGWNARFVIDAPMVHLRRIMAKVGENIRRPDREQYFVTQYVYALHNAFDNAMKAGLMGVGWTDLMVAFVEMGVLDAFITFIREDQLQMEDQKRYASLTICWLLKCGSIHEKRSLGKKLKNCGVVELCLERAQNNPLFMQRYHGTDLLKFSLSDTTLPLELSVEQTAGVIEVCCNIILAGLDRTCTEFANPRNEWQLKSMRGVNDPLPSGGAPAYCKRMHAIMQENCMMSVNAILLQSPPLPRAFILKILQYKPTIIDQLLACAKHKRQPWFPDLQLDSFACECLGMIVQAPLHILPGMDFPPSFDRPPELVAEMEAHESVLKLFASRQGWSLNLLEIWKKLDDESYPTIMEWFDCIQDDYHAVDPPSVDVRANAAQYRGRMRVLVLRIIATMCYSDSISNDDLTLLVGLVFDNFQLKAPLRPSEDRRAVPVHLFDNLDRNEQVSLKASLSISVEPMVIDDAVLQAPSRKVMGRVAFVRMLIRLTERGLLEKIPTWSLIPLPDHLASFGNLQLVKRIATPNAIQKIIGHSVQKIPTLRKEANELVKDQRDSVFQAREQYRHIAELVANIITYHQVSGQKWPETVSGIWRELVFALGNAVEMSLRLQEYSTALGFATITVDVAQRAPEGETVTEAVLAKNVRRLNEAKSHIRGQ